MESLTKNVAKSAKTLQNLCEKLKLLQYFAKILSIRTTLRRVESPPMVLYGLRSVGGNWGEFPPTEGSAVLVQILSKILEMLCFLRNFCHTLARMFGCEMHNFSQM